MNVGQQCWFWDNPHIRSGTVVFEIHDSVLVKTGVDITNQVLLLFRWRGGMNKSSESMLSSLAFESYQQAVEVVVAWFDGEAAVAKEVADRLRQYLFQ